MRQAITTKYYGPTNYRPSRIRAKASAGVLFVPWDHALNIDMNHMRAAEALVRKMGWCGRGFAGTWVAGGLPEEDGNVFVYTGEGDDPNGWPAGSAFSIEFEGDD